MRRIIGKTLLCFALLAGCGGNYSNEDIDYQLALPERDDIAVKLPAQAVEIADSAEYYRSTRETVKVSTGVANFFLRLIDYVRAYPPTTRLDSRRVWGPFADREHPGWELRMSIDRVGDPSAPARFEYALELRSAKGGEWHVLISGFFAPAGGVRRGTGQLRFLPTDARATGYPLDATWEALVIDYDTKAFPIHVQLTLDTLPNHDRVTYDYSEEQSGAGSMIFDFPTPQGAPIVTALRMHS